MGKSILGQFSDNKYFGGLTIASGQLEQIDQGLDHKWLKS